jgi:hypothetical protein
MSPENFHAPVQKKARTSGNDELSAAVAFIGAASRASRQFSRYNY